MPRTGFPQRIRDPIHDIIVFNDEPFEKALFNAIQSVSFQRLRRIKQLGFSDFVYPGATHTRFAHSLGVFNTARQLVDVIRRETGNAFSRDEAQVALTAALFHDIGHGPFSHAFESVFTALGLNKVKHELASSYYLTDEDVSSHFSKQTSGLCADAAKILLQPFPKTIYHAVVSSQFDGDRLDYMRRDRTMCGSMHGVIDYQWLISNLKVGSVPLKNGGPTVDTFIIGEKATYAAESYVLGLFQLYPSIYFHKATRGLEKLFVELMVRFFDAVRSNDKSAFVLDDRHPLVVFARTFLTAESAEDSKMRAMRDLDDYTVWGSIKILQSSSDGVVATLSERIINRRLYKCFDLRIEIARELVSKDLCQDDLQEVKNGKTIVDRNVDDIVSKIKDWRTAHPDLLALIDIGERSPYKTVQDEKSSLNQILVMGHGGQVVDLAEYSAAVRSVRPFKFARCYFEKDSSDETSEVEEFLRAQIGRLSFTDPKAQADQRKLL